MAATAPTAAQTELINSLTQDEIPIKLRCAICSKLAVNAFRLPCCEQAICESCQSSLPSSCPVCEHSPVAAEDCKPHKSLRTTIKVFLRTEEKKREALKAKEAKSAPTPEPVVKAPAAVEEVPAPDEQPVEAEVDAPNQHIVEQEEAVDETEVTGGEQPEEEQDVPHQSIEDVAPGEGEEEANAEVGDDVPEEAGVETGGDAAPESTLGAGLGAGVAFPNMGMMGQGVDFNAMQMMMMQNGMAPNAFGGFPMMGMPGMSVDPMAMQNMFGGGGMGMNLGMGMGDFSGIGFNNGWNQQSWNVGQDNFNHPNATGMGHGDFGANNSGFQQAGYNQGNYGRQYNDYQNGYGNQGHYPRGRGRGRGYGGRGGYNNFGGHHYAGNNFQNGSTSENGSVPTGPKAASVAASATAENVDEFGREIRQTSEKEKSEAPDAAENDTETPQKDGPKPIQTLEEIERQATESYGAYGVQPPTNVIVPDVPINAPTGPKAMREGLPNTSLVNLRGRGGYGAGRGVTRHNGVAEPTPVQGSEPEREEKREKSRTPLRSPSRSRSRSRSRDRRRHRRHRSTSMSEDGKEEERRRERRRKHSRRYDDDGDERVGSDKTDRDEARTRSQSPEERRSSHRSRRGRDGERDRDRERGSGRDRDRDKERDKENRSSSHRHRSSHRSHRDRSRSRSRSRDRARDRERDRHDRDRKRHHRRQHDSVEPEERLQPTTDREAEVQPEIKPPAGPRAMIKPSGIDIRGSARRRSALALDVSNASSNIDRRSSNPRRSESSSQAPTPTGPKAQADPQALEREARNRERLVKEAQRMAGLAGGGRKREREDAGSGGSRKRRNEMD